MKKLLKKILLMIPGVSKMIAKRDSFMSMVKPGHFYSPIPDIPGILKEEKKI